MRSLLSAALVGAILAAAMLPAHAADKQLADRLKAAAVASTLDASLRPWHWKLDVTLFDAKGKNPQQGAIEVWASPDGMRTVETLGATTITTLRVGAQLYRTAGDDTAILPLDLLLQQALKPIPEVVYQHNVPLQVVVRKSGQKSLDCIRPTLIPPSAAIVSNGYGLNYCLSQTDDELSLSIQAGSVMMLRARTGKFLAIDIPIELQLWHNEIVIAKATTTALATVAPQAVDLQLSPDLPLFLGPIAMPSKLLGDMILERALPSYPDAAKLAHVGGSVHFDVVIGVDGNIRSLQQAGRADQDLAHAAEIAVRQSIYRPFLLNGVAVQVKSTVEMNFNIR